MSAVRWHRARAWGSMDPTSFEMIVSVQDGRFTDAVRVLVTSVAGSAGCEPSASAAFAAAVDAAVRKSLHEVGAGALLPVTVRRQGGLVEVLVNGHLLTLDA